VRLPTCSAILILLTATIFSCGTGKLGGPDDGEFSVDDYPPLVNATPITITGTKPSGNAVQVDGAERIPANSQTTWSLPLDLAEGENSFLFEPVDQSGAAGTGETVTISLDSIPPSVVSKDPDTDATDVPLNAIVTVVFSEPVDCTTVTASVFSIVGVTAAIDCTTGNPTVLLTPAANLDPQTEYTVLLLSDVSDPAGNRMAGDANWRFTTGDTTAAVCGDNNPEGTEECDDGKNGDNCDGCLDDCTQHTNTCGDTYQCGTEECDDGNNGDNCDGCLDDCTTVVNGCGDTYQCGAEECDDGQNGDNCDGCLDDCTNHTNTCGDTYQCGAEECDDGNNGDPCDGCLDGCTTIVNGCGDTHTCGAEECDDGLNGNSCDGCLDDCTQHTNFCGDGYPCGTEECDDGDNDPGDGCSATCTNETNPVCGDTIPQAGEDCDDGKNGNNCDGCLDDCTAHTNVCGDTYQCGSEQCDDGQDGDQCDGCLDDCTTHTNICGDTYQCGSEQCDDGQDGDPCDGCLDDCTTHTNTCGDTYHCGGEQCDDGNNGDNCDGCLNGCIAITNGCGDTYTCAPEQCDDGQNGDNCDGCLDDCTQHTNFCGDGNRCGSEECDDRNNDPGDGCSPTCTLECINPPTPTVNPVVSPTGANRQVLTGTKGANTALLINDVVVVPLNSSTNWDAQVTLASGTNSFKIEARDGTGTLSCPANVDIDYAVPSPVDTAGELKIELEVQSVWRMIGDEFRVGSRDRKIIDAFDVQVWIEGPLTVIDDQGTADPTDDVFEPCYYDAANFQRKYTRYVKTLGRHVFQGCLDINPPNLCWGYWWEPNYWAPNWFAALVEYGWWNTGATPAGQRIPPSADRRNAQGHTIRWSGSGPCPPTFFPWNNGCRPRMTQPPVIDGVTEATAAPRHDGWNPPHPATRGSGPNGVGALVGQWTDQRSYTWNLHDVTGNPIREGAYLVSINVIPDRALPANIHFPDFLASDFETCWDDPSQADEGMHRAEGVIVIDSTTPQTVYWMEEGAAETVDACSSPNPNIWCDGHIDFTIMQDYAAAWATPDPPCSLLGDPVKYLKVPAGWPGPVKVQYCPNAACP
jgi:cysteine-rich repeat protein